MTAPVRAVIVDDSAAQREVLRAVLAAGGVDVVGEAADGEAAVDLVARLRPGVVVMDIDMPRVDGFEATRRIMAATPTPIVIVTASREPCDVALALQVTELGALTVQPKPRADELGGPAATRLAELVRAMADVAVVGRRRRAGRAEAGAVAGAVAGAGAAARRRSREPVRVVGVGASTGGPPALIRFLGALHPLPVPVLVVQHLPETFIDGFVSWLASATPMPVRLATSGGPLRPGVVHVAPPARHLELADGMRAHLRDGPPEQGFRPSVSALFRSMAEVAGAGAAAVVLTGMGTDGLQGARAVHEAGGRVLVQDEESSAVFGMPRVVAEAGLAGTVGPVEALAREIVSACETEVG